MKNTGMFRVIDDLGRIVIPKEIRKSLGIKPGDEMSIHVEKRAICLKPVKSECLLCGGDSALIEQNGVSICESCIERLERAAKAK